MTAQRAAEGIERGLATRHIVATRAQALKLEMLVRVGETELVQRALDEMDDDVRAAGETRVVVAALRLARDDPDGAATALEPIFAGASPIENPRWEIQALLLKASVDDALGDTGASSRAMERALDLAEPGGVLLPFVLHPAPELLERHSRLRSTHGALISEILNQSGATASCRPRAGARTRGEWKAGLSARWPSRHTGLRRAESRKWRRARRWRNVDRHVPVCPANDYVGWGVHPRAFHLLRAKSALCVAQHNRHLPHTTSRWSDGRYRRPAVAAARWQRTCHICEHSRHLRDHAVQRLVVPTSPHRRSCRRTRTGKPASVDPRRPIMLNVSPLQLALSRENPSCQAPLEHKRPLNIHAVKSSECLMSMTFTTGWF